MYKQDLQLDNPLRLICHKTQPTEPLLQNSQPVEQYNK